MFLHLFKVLFGCIKLIGKTLAWVENKTVCCLRVGQAL